MKIEVQQSFLSAKFRFQLKTKANEENYFSPIDFVSYLETRIDASSLIRPFYNDFSTNEDQEVSSFMC